MLENQLEDKDKEIEDLNKKIKRYEENAQTGFNQFVDFNYIKAIGKFEDIRIYPEVEIIKINEEDIRLRFYVVLEGDGEKAVRFHLGTDFNGALINLENNVKRQSMYKLTKTACTFAYDLLKMQKERTLTDSVFEIEDRGVSPDLLVYFKV